MSRAGGRSCGFMWSTASGLPGSNHLCGFAADHDGDHWCPACGCTRERIPGEEDGASANDNGPAVQS